MDNKKKKLVFLVVLLLGCVATSLVSKWNGGSDAAAGVLLATSGKADKAQAGKKKIVVYVSGEVLEPGMYELASGSRALDAVTAAGGMTAAADKDRVNLARALKDGNQVNVPAQKQTGKKAVSQTGSSASKASKSKSDTASKSGTAVTNGACVRINSASAAELQALPGVGPALAQRIVAYRQGKRFTSADDLLQVKGIGKAKLERLRPLVEVD